MSPFKEPVGQEASEDSGDGAIFAFDIPAGTKEGVSMIVKAPDGVELHIPRPGNVFPGDRMCMVRKDMKWGIKSVVRKESLAASVEESRLTKWLKDPTECFVGFRTTKGWLNLRIVPQWAPLGAQRFMQLVTDKYYTDVAIYRGVPNFLIQFGVVCDPVRNDAYQPIKDDCVRGVPIEDGTVCFATIGPNLRTSTICIFLGEYPQLGHNPWETPIGKVCPESMDVLHSIVHPYGDMPQQHGSGPNPCRLQDEGNDYIRQNFPECDFVISAEWLTVS